jgi:hypothetical protein
MKAVSQIGKNKRKIKRALNRVILVLRREKQYAMVSQYIKAKQF